MKVRLIGGIREGNSKDPLMGVELQAVAFPMTVPNYNATESSDPEEITLTGEQELLDWADSAFDDTGYEIFNLDIPFAIPLLGISKDARKVLDLISAKKAEYENAAPSTPTGQAECDAVVAALDTLDVHARSVLSDPDKP